MTLSLVTILSGFEINNFAGQPASRYAINLPPCLAFFRPWFGAILRIFRRQPSLVLENPPLANDWSS